MPLRDALRKVGNFVEDIATVEVQTYTGSVALIDAATAPNLPVADGQSRFAAILAKAKDTADLKLVGHTVLDFSGDALLFRSNDPEVGTEALLAAHDSAVTAGIQSRQAIVDLFKDIVLGD